MAHVRGGDAIPVRVPVKSRFQHELTLTEALRVGGVDSGMSSQTRPEIAGDRRRCPSRMPAPANPGVPPGERSVLPFGHGVD